MEQRWSKLACGRSEESRTVSLDRTHILGVLMDSLKTYKFPYIHTVNGGFPRTFREDHHKFVDPSFPWRLQSMRLVIYAKNSQWLHIPRAFQGYRPPIPRGSWSHLHPSWVWHRIPVKWKKGWVHSRCKVWERRHTKGWSFLHCLRSSARRALQIPDMVAYVTSTISIRTSERAFRVRVRLTPILGEYI